MAHAGSTGFGPTHPTPPARCAHTAAAIEGGMLLFGGRRPLTLSLNPNPNPIPIPNPIPNPTPNPDQGYSITVNMNEDDKVSQNAAPWVSLLDDEAKIVTSRLGPRRFRIAGTAEFNGAP